MATTTYVAGTVITSASLNDFDALSYQGTLPPTATGVPYARRNYLINGSMNVWQRGTSFAAVATAAYTADRWKTIHAGATVDITRQNRTATDACPAEFYMRVSKSAGIGAVFGTQQIAERPSFEAFKGKAVVLSVYLRKGASLVSDISIQFASTAAEGTTTANLANQTQTVTAASLNTSTFVRASQVIQIPTTNTDLGCFVQISSNQAGAANVYFEVTAVQLEIAPLADGGTYINVPSQYEPPRWDEDVAACHRFFFKTFPYATTPAQNAGVIGSFGYTAPIAGAVQTLSGTDTFPTRMRTTPTMTYFNPSAANAFSRNFTRTTDSTATVSSGALGDNSMALAATGLAGWVVGDLILTHFTADAEF